MYLVYLLRSLKDGKYYIGQTNDMAKRLAEHNNGYSTDLTFGARSSGGTPYKGLIDDVRIYNYARTQKQIVEDMLGSPKLVSAGGNGGQVGYWKFDEGYGTTAYDNSINANNLTLSTASWTNSGKFGKAWNGTGALRLSRADDADFDVTATDDYAMSLWFKSDSATNPSAIEYLVNKASSVIAGYAVYANTSGQICFGIDDDTTWNPDIASCSTADFYDATWHHIAAIRDTVQDKTYIYIDGVLKDSDSDTTTATLANSLLLYVGDRDGTDNGDEFNGDIDELKIYRYALTSDEVKIEYNHGGALALGSDNAYCIPGDSTTCTAPVGEWNFEEGSGASAYDSSGNGNTGTITNATWALGKIGSALNFDGSGDYITAGTGANVTTGVTLEAWIYPTSLSGSYKTIVSRRDESGPQYQLYLNTGTGILRYYNGTEYTSAYTPTINTWTHVAATNNNGTLVLYANGVQVYTTTGVTIPVVTAGLYIGSIYNGSETFLGKIDQVRIFNYARTAAQVAWDYNRGSPVGEWKFDECQGATANDSSGNGNTGTITIGATGTQTSVGNCSTSATTAWYSGRTGKYNSSLNFDGTDDYVSTTVDPLGTNYTNNTISVWINTSSTAATWKNIFQRANITDGTSIATQVKLLNSSSGRVVVDDYFPSGGALTGNKAVNDGVWHNITIVRSTTARSIYIDGILDITESSPETYAGLTPNKIYIGVDIRSGVNSAYFPGQIDDVQIYNYALTATQIKNLFNQNSAIRFGPQTGSP